jgi:type IV pilus assembly protein PilV
MLNKLKPIGGSHGVGTRHLPRGFTMLEVLVAVVITTLGLLGLAGLMSKMQVAETESYQRSQALVLLSDMVERINAAEPRTVATANAYAVSGTDSLTSPAGTGDSQPADCSGVAMGAARDICEWSNALKGAAETSGGTNVGAMIGARGCVELITAPNPATGTCTPATYRVSVVWQGLVPSAAPATTCGTGLYGSESTGQRRAVAEQLTIGIPTCTMF